MNEDADSGIDPDIDGKYALRGISGKHLTISLPKVLVKCMHTAPFIARRINHGGVLRCPYWVARLGLSIYFLQETPEEPT